MEEAKKVIGFLGKQFMLESDQDYNRDVNGGTTSVYQRPMNAGMAYASMKRSQIFEMASGGGTRGT